LKEEYKGKYKKDNTVISGDDLEKSPLVITPYISRENALYLDKQEIEIACDSFIRETIYSGLGEERNIIFFKSRKLREEYKRELIYFIGDLLRRKSLDYLPEEFDIKCQYSDVVPLIIEYLFLRDTGHAERFSSKHLSDLSLNAPEYMKIYERYNKYEGLFNKEDFLRNTLLYLVPLSSMDATLQIIDELGNDKDELKKLLNELINNESHNREAILKDRNIETYGFRRLRKEIIRK
jgi:hypothetical protein